MSIPKDHVQIRHGSLTINVPRSLYSGINGIPDEPSVKRFRKMLSERYPWLSENALDVLMRNARDTIIETLDEETCGRARANELVLEGNIEKAISHLRKHLAKDSKNIDTMYLLGELLCKTGKTEEGYAMIAKARRSFE